MHCFPFGTVVTVEEVNENFSGLHYAGEGDTREFNFISYADFVPEVGLLDSDYVTTFEVVHKASIGELTKKAIPFRFMVTSLIMCCLSSSRT